MIHKLFSRAASVIQLLVGGGRAERWRFSTVLLCPRPIAAVTLFWLRQHLLGGLVWAEKQFILEAHNLKEGLLLPLETVT